MNNNSDDEVLLGEWMDLDNNSNYNQVVEREDLHGHGHTQPSIPRSQSMDDTKASKRLAVGQARAPSRCASRIPGECLSSSFDFSLLNAENRDVQHNSMMQLHLTPTLFRNSASWDECELSESDSCKRIKFAEIAFDASTPELPPPPTTVRKLARQRTPALASALSPQHPGTPATTQQSESSCVKKSAGKLTPASAKRRRAPTHLRRSSPMGRVQTPRAAAGLKPTGNSAHHHQPLMDGSAGGIHLPYSSHKHRRPKVSLGTTTTAASTLLETTTDTIESTDTLESNTPFRFNSFPASLPRINSVAEQQQQQQHALFPSSVRKRTSFGEQHHQYQQHHHHPNSTNLVYYPSCRDDDTHNTSVSSLHDEGNYAYSEGDDDDNNSKSHHEDDDAKGSPSCTPVARTRLNFMQVESPTRHPVVAAAAATTAFRQHPERFELDSGNLNTSSLSSEATIKTSTGSEDSTSPSRCVGSALHLKSSTPLAVQLQFQLDEAQCSPIPGIPEEPTTHQRISSTTSSRERKNASEAGTASCASSNSTRQTSRPMPDLNAFDGEAGCSSTSRDRSTDDSGISSTRSHPSSPKLLCPPTPVRTPAWAHIMDNHTDGHHYPFFKNSRRPPIGRSDSLIATKVLATCELPGLGRNNSELEGGSGIGGLPHKRPALSRRPQQWQRDNPEGGWLQAATHHHDEAEAAAPSGREQVEDTTNGPAISMNFDVVSLLGSGAFAEVYKVRSRTNGEHYALKRSRRQFRGKRDRERALLEVRHMQHLQRAAMRPGAENDGIFLLFFYQAWQQDGYFYCLTELCCRATCRELIDDFRSQHNPSWKNFPSIGKLALSMTDSSSCTGVRILPERTVWKICHDIAAGLRHIHSQGLVHNDIKPSNIFLIADEKIGTLCKIGDFGMTREIGSTDDGEEGDQKYMAREVLESGKKEASADILSLGLSLYELSASLAFELPADGPRWHELRRGHHSLDVPTCRSAALRGTILSMMDPNPSRRPLAKELLGLDLVASSGSSRDEFLNNYICDCDQQAKLEEESDAVRAEQTPRNAPSRTRSCSPSMGNLHAAPLIYSPEASLL